MTDLFASIEQPADVILLDYVMTLVSNTGDKEKLWQPDQPYTSWIALEEYRSWLVDLIRDKTVALIMGCLRTTVLPFSPPALGVYLVVSFFFAA